MKRIAEFIDTLPFWPLVIIALAIGVAPWPIGPEPHLVEKARMLAAGTLHRPIDILDVVYHLTPLVILGVRLARLKKRRNPF